MQSAQKALEVPDRGEFMRIDPALIKVDSSALLWRENHPQDLETLKSSILWRERRMKGSGLLVPLLVSKIQGVEYYQLEDGFRRFRAIQSLLAEGIMVDSIPVLVLPAPLTLSERLMLVTHGPKPLSLLEESRIITRLEKQGLSFDRMAALMDRPEEVLRRRAVLAQLTGPLLAGLREGVIKPEEIEPLLNANEDVVTQQRKLEVSFRAVIKEFGLADKKSPKKDALGEELGRKNALVISDKTKTAWVPKVLDPMLHYVSIEGLYEWMGGDEAAKRGYNKTVVESVKLMLKYTGGKIGLQDVAEKLRKL